MDSHWSLYPRLSDVIVWPSTLDSRRRCLSRGAVESQSSTKYKRCISTSDLARVQFPVEYRIPDISGYTVWDKCGMFIEIWQAKSLAMCALEEKLCLASQFHVNSRGWNAKMVLSRSTHLDFGSEWLAITNTKTCEGKHCSLHKNLQNKTTLKSRST